MNLLQNKWDYLVKNVDWEYKDNRQRPNAFLRYYFFAWASKLKKGSLTEIANIVNRDSHATVLNGLKQHTQMLNTNYMPYVKLFNKLNKINNIESYQIAVCPECRGYVYMQKYPVDNPEYFTVLMKKKFIIEYAYIIPKPCKCNNNGIINKESGI